jgi:hypothetical protein
MARLVKVKLYASHEPFVQAGHLFDRRNYAGRFSVGPLFYRFFMVPSRRKPRGLPLAGTSQMLAQLARVSCPYRPRGSGVTSLAAVES